MTTKKQKDDKLLPATLEELIIDMELNPDKYKHLQFIMNRHKNSMMDFGQMYLVVNQEAKKHQVTYNHIGVFHTDYTPETGAPRQGILMPDVKGKIEIYPEYQNALKSLELFEYIIVIYHFDKAGKWQDTVRPPASAPELTFGLFATRSPNRPNSIGIATIKLEKIENGILHVSGIDAFNGTPVLDIKPYLPSIDGVKSIKNESIEKKLGLQ